jgi:hypothetical protein
MLIDVVAEDQERLRAIAGVGHEPLERDDPIAKLKSVTQ